ncbi:MAG: DUF4838 domain-containing protein [Acidobacteriota bacterium]|nr:DUF4838 domain-containing protein [Acidobacteriota bacterium]
MMTGACFQIGGREGRVALPAGASRALEFAADQLSYYVAVVTGSQYAPGGETGEFALDPSRADLGEGGYEIAVEPGAVRLSGAGDLAVLHAVYHFLEQGAGCRWLSAFEGGEIVPRREDLAVPCGVSQHRPVFRSRAFTNFPDIDERTVEMVDWMCKNRFDRFMIFANAGDSFERYAKILRPHLELRGMKVEMGHHSFRYWLPPEVYFDAHPEWFSLVDGERRRDGQVCTSNPRVAEVMAERIGAFFDENPEIDRVGLWPNDGYGWCRCAECEAMEPQRPSLLYPSEPARTDTYIAFVNRVAGLLAETHPDRKLSALAYVNYVEPPSMPVAGNVDVCFAAMHRCFKHPFQGHEDCTRDNARYAALFEQWKGKVPGLLTIFCYLMQIDMCSVIYPIAPMLGANFRWLAEHGCDGYVMEFKPEEWGTYGGNAHLIGRLSWEPGLDTEKWQAQYFADKYGPAAEEMGKFRASLVERFVEPGPCVYHYDLGYTRRATPELLRPALEHLGRARALASTGESRHIEAVEQDHVSAGLLLRMGEWQRALEAAQTASGVKRQVLVERAQECADELLAWAWRHEKSGSVYPPYLETRVRRTMDGLSA